MIEIQTLQEEHWTEVSQIFKDGIATKNATFEINVPNWTAWNEEHFQHSRFVAVQNNVVVGWVAISPVSKRDVYKGVAEISVYVSLQAQGKGVANALMEKVIQASEKNKIWTLYASIFPENEVSMYLHKKHEFRFIGKRERIAQQEGVWRDTFLFERRSEKVGN
ncbi:MAG: GNAT family N-acetyltransferase [Polaribacter sp.]|nr:GNAT family N-acetyltransferase [Polaribacter sp.]